MSDASTRRLIAAYIEQSAPARGFLAGFFNSGPRTFYRSEEVEIDIQRDSEEIATPVPSISVRGNGNEVSAYTNKKFKPPIYKEEFPLNAFDMMNRQPGQSPFADPNYMANAMRQMTTGMRKLSLKIFRAMELQCAQILQTGKVSLTNNDGVVVYDIDFKPKTTHFPTVGNNWSGGSSAILEDLENLGNTVTTDGKSRPMVLVCGRGALRNLLGDAEVKAQLDNRRMHLGEIQSPVVRGNGGIYHGTLSAGQYKFEVWSYDGFYKHPQTGAVTYYVADDSVIMVAPGRRDMTFGDIPRIVAPDPRVAPLVLGRVSDAEVSGMDLHTNAWVSPDGSAVYGSVGSRPLAVPVAIDTFACLNTEI